MGIHTFWGDSNRMSAGNASKEDPRYERAMQDMDTGAWSKAADAIQGLLQDYPGDRDQLSPILSSARMRVSVGGKRIRGRGGVATFLNRRRRTQLLVLFMLLVVAAAGFGIFRFWLTPLRAQQALTQAFKSQLEQGQIALAATDYTEAETRFTAALALKTDSVEAQTGLAETQHLQAIQTDYTAAIDLAAKGENATAMDAFLAIQSQEPDYKDVAKRIDQLAALSSAKDLFAQAQEAYQQERWDEAISLFTGLRDQNVAYQQVVVEAQFNESLLQAANRDALSTGQSNAQIEQSISRYRQALSLQPGNPVAQARMDMLTAYIQAKGLIGQGRVAQAEQIFTNIYAADANLLGSDLPQILFDTRMALGNQYEQAGDLWAAYNAYLAAASLPVPRAGEARQRAEAMGLALTPTVTPTATPIPTATPDPLALLYAQLTPTPVPSPLEQFVGWIAFYSDRPGSSSGLWVMRPDGSGVQPASDPSGLYKHLELQATWFKDNSRRIWVESDGTEVSIAIYMWRYDIPQHWNNVRVELLNNSATNYQIQLSPNDRYVVFTSQRGGAPGGTGNTGDEIFIMDLNEIVGDGYHVGHRLTFNDWQWDKHPTFSADGNTIFFWSNREIGKSQIWAMSLDGNNQRSISDGEYNDWDPLFVVPYRAIPTHKEMIKKAPTQ